MANKKYDPTEVLGVNLKRLGRVDSRAFVELCEKAGYLSVAFDFYSTRRDDKDLEHAVEIAKRLSGLPKERRVELVRRLGATYRAGLREAVPSRGLGGDWADAYSEASADARQEEYQGKLEQLSHVETELLG